jgi:hypothetical protein
MTTKKENEKESKKAESESQADKEKSRESGGEGSEAKAQGDRPRRLEPNLPEYQAKDKEYEQMLEEDAQRTKLRAEQRAGTFQAQAAAADREAERAEEIADEKRKK